MRVLNIGAHTRSLGTEVWWDPQYSIIPFASADITVSNTGL